MPTRRTSLPVLAALAVTVTALALSPATPAPAAPAPVAAAAAAPVVDPIPTPDGPPGTRTRKSLVIGIDGGMLDRILDADTPNLQALIAAGTSSKSYRYAGASGAGLDPQASTVSGPGWSTLLTGVWPDKHGVRDNSFAGKDYTQYPDYLTRAEALDPSVSTFAVADWDPIATESAGGSIISDRVDVRIGLRSDTDSYGYTANDARSADVAARYLATEDPDLAFVYLGKTDIAGHASGAESQAFLDSLAADDQQIGLLLDAIAARATYASEDWQVIVTNDHGHTPTGGHGGSSLAEREQFVIAAGGGVPAGPRRADLNVTDIVASVYDHVGLGRDPGLDGTPFRLVAPDAFDSVRPALRTRTDETAVPAGLLGYTHTPPEGWSVDNSAMPAGGVTEWRGWAFTTNEFWTSTDRGQGREGFVRGRDLIAVADSDEYADRAGGASFDSTLVSPAYDVARASTAVLEFQTWYQQEAPQRGEVSVAFDGGAPAVVRTYTANARGLQRIEVAVPAGARTMQVRFRYTGSNNWYWALDQVVVAAGPRTPEPTDEVTVVSNARSQCVDGRVAVAVHARNTGTRPTDIRLTTRWGEARTVGVRPGAAAYRLFETRRTSVRAGSAQVAGYAWIDGRGSYTRQSPSYAALRC